ncbi:MAG: 30S ribosomal protein S6, partial [Candidatus Zixiibacteriota bacterium]
MRTYETVFVINPQTDDATIDRHVTAVVDIIKNDGGEVHRENRLGTRRLAYEINGLVQGFFASIIFDGPTSVLPKLDRH